MAGASRVQISEKLRQIHKDYLSNLAGGLNAFVAFIDEPSESLLAAAAYNLCGCARSEATARYRITCSAARSKQFLEEFGTRACESGIPRATGMTFLATERLR